MSASHGRRGPPTSPSRRPTDANARRSARRGHAIDSRANLESSADWPGLRLQSVWCGGAGVIYRWRAFSLARAAGTAMARLRLGGAQCLRLRASVRGWPIRLRVGRDPLTSARWRLDPMLPSDASTHTVRVRDADAAVELTAVCTPSPATRSARRAAPARGAVDPSPAALPCSRSAWWGHAELLEVTGSRRARGSRDAARGSRLARI